MNEIARFPSNSSAGKFYVVKGDQEGNLSCDCPAWRFKKPNQERSCNHTKAVASGRSAPAPAPVAQPVEGMYEPMLAEKADEPFNSEQHLFEVKYDGAREVAYVKDGKVRLIGRSGADHTANFPELQEMAGAVNASEAVLDGEVVVEENGKLNFGALQSRVHTSNGLGIRAGVQKFPVTFVAFDILRIQGIDLTAKVTRMELKFRKAVLDGALTPGPRWHSIGYDVGDGIGLFQDAMRMGHEGIMAKRLNGLYHPGKRTDAWLKIKGVQEDSFLVGGYTEGTGWRQSLFGALLLGKPDGQGGLRYCGSVGTGFTEDSLREVLGLFNDLRMQECPFAQRPDEPKLAWYLLPRVVVDVKYHELTPDRKLRFPVFLRVRYDLKPEEVRA